MDTNQTAKRKQAASLRRGSSFYDILREEPQSEQAKRYRQGSPARSGSSFVLAAEENQAGEVTAVQTLLPGQPVKSWDMAPGKSAPTVGPAAAAGYGRRPSALGSGATTTLNYGVPGAIITDPFYRDAAEKRLRSGRSTGRARHLGIDVSLSNRAGGGADDVRRGQPVYAALPPSLDIDALNQTAVFTDPDSRSGLGIPGSGMAKLNHAKVRVQPWSSDSDGAYGGVLGLACRYDYVKGDGTAGKFTIYIEYLHLITDRYLPKDGSGNLIAAEAWRAAGKPTGFGPRMREGAVLSAADLSGAVPLLVGYLGATQFPHVHIQAAYAEGERDYLRRPRFDPTAVLQPALTVSGLSAAQGLPVPSEVIYDVPAGQKYGARWRDARPPGLPDWVRLSGGEGSATPYIEQIAGDFGLGDTFVRTVTHLAVTESGARFGLPANRFDARPPAARGGAALITAWGAFQFNRDAWTELIPAAERNHMASWVAKGSGGCGPDGGCVFPWDTTPYDELFRPIQKYAQLFQDVTGAGGTPFEAARGIRLWHRSPNAFRRYVSGGRSGGFASAWQGVDAAHRGKVDEHLGNAGITA